MLKMVNRAISLLLATVLTIQPAILHAGDIANTLPDTSRPRVDQSYNGTTVLNIATPNSAGVSHDIYSRFVADDLILNNSATNVSTQLGGWIEGNPNLRPGQAASLWIGEVVGASQTQLNGILEVAGQRMDVVLANEQGIICNGCGFINTGRTTLTTGVPRFSSSGALEGFDVRQGTVTVGADGLNPESRIALNDTSRVDVLARAAVIYGKMRADGLNIVAGANAIDYNWSYDPLTGAVTGVTPISGSGAAPALAVDVSALGGMYANAIQMVATEAGVGVRMDGQMASSTNIALNAKGQLSLGAASAVKARTKVVLRSVGPMQLEGSVTSEQGDLIDLGASAGSMRVGGQVSGGEIRLESAGPAEISAAIDAQGSLGVTSTGDAVTIASAASLKGDTIAVEAAKSVIVDGTLNAQGALTVNALDGAISGSGTLSGNTTTLAATDAYINGGIVTAKTDLTITADAVTNTGAMMAGRDIALYADTITNAGGAIWANRDIVLAANAALDPATAVTNSNGRIEAFQGDLTIRAGAVTNEGTAPTISQSQITRWLETATAEPLIPDEEIVKLIDPAYLGADGKILPAYASEYTALWSGLLGGGSLSSDALSIMKSAVLTSDGTAVASDFVSMWNNMVARANEEGTASPAAAVRDLVNSNIFDLSGKVKSQYAAAYAELWDTLASGSTVVSDSVKAILKNASLQEAGTTTDPDTGETVTLYSNTLVSEITDLWAAMKDASSGTTYNIVKFLYQDRFDDNGKLAELVAGGNLSIEADEIHNLYANISAGGDLALTANTVENKALGASQVLFEVHKRPDCFTCHEGKLEFYDTFGGRIEANGNVTISGAFTNDTLNSSTLATGEVVAKLNAYIAEKTAEGDPLMAGVPLISSKNYELIDQRDDSATVPAAGNGTDIRVTVSVDNSATASASPADPTITATPSVDALVAAGLTTLAEADPEFTQYANFITSNYMMAEGRLAYRDDLVANGREALATALGRAEANVANGTDFPDGAVKVPATDGSGLITVHPASASLALTGTGALVAGASVAVSGSSVANSGTIRALNDLTVSADSITARNGIFSAETGRAALASLGALTIEGGEISGAAVELVAGEDFTGKGLSIRSAGDTSLFAMGSATITGLETSYSMTRGNGLLTVTDQKNSALDVGGDLSIVTMADLTLAGVDGRAGGDIDLSAGGDLNLAATQSTYEFHAKAKKSSTDISSVTSHVTTLVSGGDMTATAGGNATLVGTVIETAGAVDLAAEGDVIMTAAQNYYSYAATKTKGNFLSKKVTSVSEKTLTHSGVSISAGGDMAIVAATGDLVTAGSSFTSTGGDIDLKAIEGDILAGTFTDVFESTSYSKRSILGGLLGSTTSTTTSSAINTDTAALAELDLSLVSGEDTSLIGAELAAGGKLSVTTGGDFSVQAAIDSERREFFSNKMGLVTMTTITERSFKETAKLSSFAASLGYAFDIGGEASLSLYDYAGTDGENPQDLYPEELLAIQGLELLKVSLADEYFYDKQVALSPAFKALVSIAVGTFVVPGLFATLGLNAATFGGGLLGTAIFNGATAFTSTFIVESLDGVVSGDFDIGEILKGAAFSGVTAGLTSAINVEQILGVKDGSSLDKLLKGQLIPGFGNGNLSLGGILNGALDGAISSGLSSIVYGTDFGTGFSKSLIKTVVSLALADVQFEIGDLGLAEGSLPHALLHGLAGCAAAAATGDACAAGAAAAMASALYAGTLQAPNIAAYNGDTEAYRRAYNDWKTKALATAKMISALAGYVFSEGKGENVTAGASIGASVIANNYLKHDELKLALDADKKLAQCKAFGRLVCTEAERTELEATVRGFQAISASNTAMMIEACSKGASTCAQMLEDARAFNEQTRHDLALMAPGSWGPENFYVAASGQLEYGGMVDIDEVAVRYFTKAQNGEMSYADAAKAIETAVLRHESNIAILVGGVQIAGGIAALAACPETGGLTCLLLTGAAVAAPNTVLGANTASEGIAQWLSGTNERTAIENALIKAGWTKEQAAHYLANAELLVGVIDIAAGGMLSVKGPLGSVKVTATKGVTKPVGVPDTWISKPTNKGGGTRYSNPDNPHDFVRVMPGNPNSPNPAQRQPYVIRSQNGRIVDVNGNPVASNDPAAHIPLSDFEF